MHKASTCNLPCHLEAMRDLLLAAELESMLVVVEEDKENVPPANPNLAKKTNGSPRTGKRKFEPSTSKLPLAQRDCNGKANRSARSGPSADVIPSKAKKNTVNDDSREVYLRCEYIKRVLQADATPISTDDGSVLLSSAHQVLEVLDNLRAGSLELSELGSKPSKPSDNVRVQTSVSSTQIMTIDPHAKEPVVRQSNRSRPKAPQQKRVCMHCLTSRTPEWRRGPQGPRTLCNACGIVYAKKSKRRADVKQQMSLSAIMH